jgi:hypothetical protein
MTDDNGRRGRGPRAGHEGESRTEYRTTFSDDAEEAFFAFSRVCFVAIQRKAATVMTFLHVVWG